jgi:hypothetical protein
MKGLVGARHGPRGSSRDEPLLAARVALPLEPLFGLSPYRNEPKRRRSAKGTRVTASKSPKPNAAPSSTIGERLPICERIEENGALDVTVVNAPRPASVDNKVDSELPILH